MCIPGKPEQFRQFRPEMTANSPPAKPLKSLGVDSADFDLAAAALDRLSSAEIAELARRFCSASALRRRRLAERDAALRELAATAQLEPTGRATAAALATELGRYAAAAWRWERARPPPDDPRRALLNRALALNAGRAPSGETVRRALAGLAQKQPRY